MSTPKESKSWCGLFLDPLDVLFFRDGRPFDAAHRVVSGLPLPQTIAGAVRIALLQATGFRFDKITKSHPTDIVTRLRDAGAHEGILEARFRGPWLARLTKDSHAEPLLAWPANLKALKDDSDVFLLGKPCANVSGWNFPDGLQPIGYAGKADPKFEPKLMTIVGLKKFLAGPDSNGTLPLTKCDYASHEGITGLDHRVGIGINSQSLTTLKGELYGIGLQSFASKHGLYVEVALPDTLANLLDDLPICFGGEGKYVRCVKVSPQNWPLFDSKRPTSMWYLATPTFLSPRRIANRPLPQGAELRAGASGNGLAVSGWDSIRNGPRRARFAVPAGAVYFYEGPGAEDQFLEPGPEQDSLMQEGWGFALQGNWSND